MKFIPLILTLLCGCAVSQKPDVQPPTAGLSFKLSSVNTQAPAATITPVCGSCQIAWTPPPLDPDVDFAVTNYNLYLGFNSREYFTNLICGTETNGIVEGLAGGTTYYFAVTDMDQTGRESDFSEETTFRPALLFDLHFPDQLPNSQLESSPDLATWSPRKADFTNGVWRVAFSNDVPMEFYRTK